MQLLPDDARLDDIGRTTRTRTIATVLDELTDDEFRAWAAAKLCGARWHIQTMGELRDWARLPRKDV